MAGPTDPCPACGATAFHYRFEKKSRRFWRCGECRLEQQWPLPSVAELTEYYDTQYGDGMYQVFTAAAEMKTMTARRRIKEISRTVTPAGRWLDVGCADGAFIKEASNHGIAGEGVELSSVAVELAQAGGLAVRQGSVDDLPREASYDCITMFDVIEHAIDPLHMLREVAARVSGGGHVVLTAPNLRSVFARAMGRRWWFYIPEEHLFYFDPKNLSSMLATVGLEVQASRRTYKPLTYAYGLTQFREYNPLIYKVLATISRVIPRRLQNMSIPLYIGEMMIVARRTGQPVVDARAANHSNQRNSSRATASAPDAP